MNHDAFVADNAKAGGALVFGRITYELMIQYWPTPEALKNNPVVAELMNNLPKVVFSRDKASWNNTKLWKNMIKLVYCITKKPGMTDDDFFHYWKNVHGPIGARIPGVRRLVQSHRIDIPGDARDADFDGMVELWFDGMEALLEARRSPEWRTSGEDEKSFIDHSKVAYFVSEEHSIV